MLNFKAFHDCVGPNGCNGCLNDANPDNRGLKGIIRRLGDLRQKDEFEVTNNFAVTILFTLKWCSKTKKTLDF